MDYSLIYLVHMFFVAPLFVYPFIAQKYFVFDDIFPRPNSAGSELYHY